MHNQTNANPKSPYVALKVDNDIIRNDVKTNTVSENKIAILTVTKRITSITQ